MEKNDPYYQATNVPEYEGPPPQCRKCKDFLEGGYCPEVSAKYSGAVRKVRNPKDRPVWCPKEEDTNGNQ